MRKHGGGSIIIWDFFATSGPEQLSVTDRNMNSAP